MHMVHIGYRPIYLFFNTFYEYWRYLIFKRACSFPLFLHLDHLKKIVTLLDVIFGEYFFLYIVVAKFCCRIWVYFAII